MKPQPPYYAVIFTSIRTKLEQEEYEAMADHIAKMAEQQPGYLGIESVRDAEGIGITVSYWQDLDSIRQWKAVEEHLAAQKQGKKSWYESYTVRICRVEREYSFRTAEAE